MLAASCDSCCSESSRSDSEHHQVWSDNSRNDTEDNLEANQFSSAGRKRLFKIDSCQSCFFAPGKHRVERMSGVLLVVLRRERRDVNWEGKVGPLYLLFFVFWSQDPCTQHVLSVRRDITLPEPDMAAVRRRL